MTDLDNTRPERFVWEPGDVLVLPPPDEDPFDGVGAAKSLDTALVAVAEQPEGDYKAIGRAARAQALLEAQARFVDRAVGVWEPRIRQQIAMERDAVVAAIERAGKKSGRYAFTADDVYPIDSARGEWLRLVAGIRDEAGEAATEAASQVLGLPLKWPAGGGAMRSVGSVPDATLEGVQAAIAEGQRRGYSTQQLIDGVPEERFGGIAGVFAPGRADSLARMELTTGYEHGTGYQFERAGIAAGAEPMEREERA